MQCNSNLKNPTINKRTCQDISSSCVLRLWRDVFHFILCQLYWFRAIPPPPIPTCISRAPNTRPVCLVLGIWYQQDSVSIYIGYCNFIVKTGVNWTAHIRPMVCDMQLVYCYCCCVSVVSLLCSYYNRQPAKLISMLLVSLT